MGSVLQAHCACGFESEEIFAGSGMRSFLQENCILPALCKECGILFERNVLNKTYIRCPRCRKKAHFYTDPSLQGATNEQAPIFEWYLEDEYILPDTLYLCPSCKEKNMRFYDVGSWD